MLAIELSILSIEVKQTADTAVEEVDQEWLAIEETVMLDICRRKYKACKYVKTTLLESQSELAEATGDKKWGTGLNVE